MESEREHARATAKRGDWTRVESRRRRRRSSERRPVTWRDNHKQGSRKKGITLFVDNINQDTYNIDLRKLCGRHGRVVDVYISRKQRHTTRKLFGFVRVEKEEEAATIIKELNGRKLKGDALFIKKASYDRRMDRTDVLRKLDAQKPTEDKRWKPSMERFRDGRSYTEALVNTINENMEGRQQLQQGGGQRERGRNKETRKEDTVIHKENVSELKMIEAEINIAHVEWLSRSIILDLDEYKSSDEVEKALKEICPAIRHTRKFRYILTFDSIPDIE